MNPADPRDVVLGCGGVLVVRFVDNAVVDAAGAARPTADNISED